MLIGVFIEGIVGIICAVLGYLIWKKEKITLLHDYHYYNVKEEDKKAFCTLSGMGVFSIGIGLLITAVLLGITESPWSFVVFGAAFVLGVILLIYAGIRYNS